MRDGEQHWLIMVPEPCYFLHGRGLVTAIDEVLAREFGEKLADHLPTPVIPVSTMPEAQFDVLVDRKCKLIKDLLAPGRRQRDEARGRIRTLLSMEAHVAARWRSRNETSRAWKRLSRAQNWGDVLPRLKTMQTGLTGTALELKVHFHQEPRHSHPSYCSRRSFQRSGCSVKSTSEKNTDTRRRNWRKTWSEHQPEQDFTGDAEDRQRSGHVARFRVRKIEASLLLRPGVGQDERAMGLAGDQGEVADRDQTQGCRRQRTAPKEPDLVARSSLNPLTGAS